MKRDWKLSVSILNIDFTCLEKSVRDIEKADIDSWHMDIMDGHFVDNISFGPVIVDAVSRIASLPMHSHLMISNPEKYVDKFFESGSETVTVHVETLNERTTGIMDKENIGISLNPDVPLESIYPLLDKTDRVLIMSVQAGFGGQKFIEKSVDRIAQLCRKRTELGSKFIISVDGGINNENAEKCIRAGADELIVGSYVTRARNPAERIKRIRDAVGP